jgi:hypothetical protein
MTFRDTLLAAIAAAILSAHLAFGVFGSAFSGGLWFMLAPFPILFVGLWFLPLAAAAAAFVAAVILSTLYPGNAALAYLGAVGLPASLTTFMLLVRRMNADRSLQFVEIGSVAGLLVLLLASVTLFITMAAEPNYEQLIELNRVLAKSAVDGMVQEFGGMPAGLSPDAMVETIASIGPVISFTMMTVSFLGLTYFAARLAQRFGRLSRPWPDLRALFLPLPTLVLAAVAFALTLFSGWFGLFGAYIFSGMVLLLVLTGISVVSHRFSDNPQWRWLVPLTWIAVLVGSPFLLMMPALAVAGLGLADHVFDFRGLRARSTPN